MTETAQSLAEKIRRLELQGADLLTGYGAAEQQLPDRDQLQRFRNEATHSGSKAGAVRTSREDARLGLKSCNEPPEDWSTSPHGSSTLRSRYRTIPAMADSDTRNTADEHRAGVDTIADNAALRKLPRRTLSLSGVHLPRREDKSWLALSSISSWEGQQHQQQPQHQQPLQWQQQLQQQQQHSIAAEQISILRAQLDEANHRCEQMRVQFRSTIEDLNKRLHETVAEKDCLQENRQKNELAQDALIERLQSSLVELREAYQAQERALAEADSRCEQLRAALSEQEQLAGLLRQAAASAELRRPGRKCAASTSAGPAAVGGTTSGHQAAAVSLQQWLEEADADVKAKDARIASLECELEESRKVLRESQEALEKSTEEKISRLKESSSKLLQASEERSDNLREQLNSFRARATFLEEQMDHHTKANAEHVHQLEKRIAELTADLQDQKRLSDNKNAELNEMTTEARRSAAAAATQLDDACRQSAILQKKIDTYEVMLERLRAECELERSQSQRLWRREEELAQMRSDAESRLAERDAEVVRLRELVAAVKEECARQLCAEVKLVEARQNQRNVEETGALRRQLEVACGDREQAAAQLSAARAELQAAQERAAAAELDHIQLREQLREAAATRDEALADCLRLSGELRAAAERHEDTAAELRRAADAEREALGRRLDAALRETERLAAERDRCVAAAEEAAEAGAREARELAERLGERLAAAEADAERLRRERADVLAEAAALGEREATRAAGELKRLQSALEQSAVRAAQLEAAERQLAEQLESAKVKLADDEAIVIRMEVLLDQKDNRLQQLQKELEAKDVELRTCRENVASLAEERNILTSALKGQEGQSQTDISRLLEKLQKLDHECRLAQQMLKAKNSLEAKAAYTTDNLRKELMLKRKTNEDLLGKIRWLEERIDVSAKEKATLAEANERLTEAVARLEVQRSSDVVSSTAELIEQKCLKDKIHRLQAELDRMATRCQQLQSALHLSEQQAAMTRLKQKLDSAARQSQTVSGSANGMHLRPSPSTASGLPNCQPSDRNTTLPANATTALRCPEEHFSHADTRAIVTEMRSLMSAVQRETAASAGSAVRDTLGAVLPALMSASNRLRDGDICKERLLHTGTEKPCYNTNTYIVHKSSQSHAKKWTADHPSEGHESLTSSEEGTLSHKQPHLRKKRAKVVSRSLQIEATMRCQDLEDRLFGLSKMGRHLKTEHKAIVQLLRSHEHQMEAIHDDHSVKELLC